MGEEKNAGDVELTEQHDVRKYSISRYLFSACVSFHNPLVELRRLIPITAAGAAPFVELRRVMPMFSGNTPCVELRLLILIVRPIVASGATPLVELRLAMVFLFRSLRASFRESITAPPAAQGGDACRKVVRFCVQFSACEW